MSDFHRSDRIRISFNIDSGPRRPKISRPSLPSRGEMGDKRPETCHIQGREEREGRQEGGRLGRTEKETKVYTGTKKEGEDQGKE